MKRASAVVASGFGVSVSGSPGFGALASVARAGGGASGNGRLGAGGSKRSGGERGRGGGSEPERSEEPPAARGAEGSGPSEGQKPPMLGPGPDVDRAVKANVAQDFSPPDPEVSSRPSRRRLTAAYKLRILREADGCTERGQLGALLRREGLYSSHLITWRRQREQGVLEALEPRKRGRKARPVDPLARKLAELERDNRRLQKRLEQAERIIDFQKKVAELLGIPLNRPDELEND